jgi:hypothetical protein
MKSKINSVILCLLFSIVAQAQVTSNNDVKLTSQVKQGKSIKIIGHEPVVIGNAVLNNDISEIVMRGEVTDHGGVVVIEKGFVYSTFINLPTISDAKLIVESVEGVFTDRLTGLLTNTSYYIRSYATNASGTSYGSVNIIDTGTQSNIDVNLKAKIKTYPNPSINYISLSGLMETKNYIIYNMTGKELTRGSISFNNQIDVRFLTNGLYLLKLEDFEVIKFIKE